MKQILVMSIIFILIFPVSSFSQENLIKFFDGFEKGKAENWEAHNPEDWKVVEENNNHYYFLSKPGEMEGSIRKPSAFSLIKNLNVTDFTLTLKAECLRSVETKGREDPIR